MRSKKGKQKKLLKKRTKARRTKAKRTKARRTKQPKRKAKRTKKPKKTKGKLTKKIKSGVMKAEHAKILQTAINYSKQHDNGNYDVEISELFKISARLALIQNEILSQMEKLTQPMMKGWRAQKEPEIELITDTILKITKIIDERIQNADIPELQKVGGEINMSRNNLKEIIKKRMTSHPPGRGPANRNTTWKEKNKEIIKETEKQIQEIETLLRKIQELIQQKQLEELPEPPSMDKSCEIAPELSDKRSRARIAYTQKNKWDKAESLARFYEYEDTAKKHGIQLTKEEREQLEEIKAGCTEKDIQKANRISGRVKSVSPKGTKKKIPPKRKQVPKMRLKEKSKESKESKDPLQAKKNTIRRDLLKYIESPEIKEHLESMEEVNYKWNVQRIRRDIKEITNEEKLEDYKFKEMLEWNDQQWKSYNQGKTMSGGSKQRAKKRQIAY